MTPAEPETKLPRRDWIVLPLIGVMTLLLVSLAAELIARRTFSAGNAEWYEHLILNDPVTGVRGIPNSSFLEKNPETPYVSYRFNNGAYRAGMDLQPKVSGVYRVVMAGSSIAMGLRVAREDTFAALLPRLLTQQAGRQVELYNEAMYGVTSKTYVSRFQELLTPAPDLILWFVTPRDVDQESLSLFKDAATAQQKSGNPLVNSWRRLVANAASDSPVDIAHAAILRTRTSLVLEHFLYESPSLYLTAYLHGGGQLGFVRSQWAPQEQQSLAQFSSDATYICEHAKSAGVSLVVVFLPNRATVGMISRGNWPAGYDPYKLSHALQPIVTSHGAMYIDMSPDFRNVPTPEQYFFPVDGHLTAKGHTLVSELLARDLTSGVVPPLHHTAGSISQ